MKKTLLELVQDMLVALDSEGVSSVSQTEESNMCVNIANRAYWDMASGKRWRHFRTYSQLSAGANLNELVLPSGTTFLDNKNVYYDGDPVYYMSPEAFLAYTIVRDVAESNIVSSNNINVYNDRVPVYFTSDDDETLRFDSYPSGGLDATDSMAIIWKVPTSSLTSDGQYFDLPILCFPALSQYCKSMAIAELKGDTQEGARQLREYKRMLGALASNSRLVDSDDDLRYHTVARRTNRMLTQITYRTN